MRVSVKDLNCSFGTNSVLKNIRLTFPSGSRVGLVGPNGSGKSTLMRTMMNLICQTEGEVLFSPGSVSKSSFKLKNFQKSLKELNFEERKKIAYVPQIFPYFSSPLKDVIQMIKDIHGFSFSDFKKLLTSFQLNLDQIAERSFHKLSGGMKQKVLLSLSFASKPDLILLDEPTSSLDPVSRQSFYKMCSDLPESNTLILCSHRVEEIRHLIHKVVMLEEGSVTYFGSSEDYLEEKTFCLLEVLIPNSDSKQETLSAMGFSRSISCWWHKLIPQREKIHFLSELQKNLGNEMKNIVIRDMDKGSRLID